MTRQTITETEFEVEEREVKRTDYYCDLCGGEVEIPAMASIEYRSTPNTEASLQSEGHYHKDCLDSIFDESEYHMLSDGTVTRPVEGADVRTKVPPFVSKSFLLGVAGAFAFGIYEVSSWTLGQAGGFFATVQIPTPVLSMALALLLFFVIMMFNEP